MLGVAFGAGLIESARPASAQAADTVIVLSPGGSGDAPTPTPSPSPAAGTAPGSAVAAPGGGAPGAAPSGGPAGPSGGSPTATPSAPATTPTAPATIAPPSEAPSEAPSVSARRAQRTTGRESLPLGKAARGRRGSPTLRRPPARPFRAAGALPLPAYPGLSPVRIPALTVGVPDFFIDHFAIPPFELSIYQAAGVEYDVPWQVLAAINEVETDYGRNLSVSSAGAVGWMQFLPHAWKRFGVDANGAGVKDPYNPVDAIFAAARFLRAAGAAHDLRRAISRFNHASWFADSVMLRAKLIGGMPDDLVSSISGLANGLFPVQSASSRVTRVAGGSAVNVYAKPGSPVVAVHDGTIIEIGRARALGSFITLRDALGNSYRYSRLGSLAGVHVLPNSRSRTPAQAARALRLPADPAPRGPATAGRQPAQPPAATASRSPRPQAGYAPSDTPASLPGLAALPRWPEAFAPAGHAHLARTRPATFASYYLAPDRGLRRRDLDLTRLTKGSHVIAGTILGRLGASPHTATAHFGFQIRPQGKGAPLIDPKPILAELKLLDASIEHAVSARALFGPVVTSPTIGQILLERKAQLQQRVLADRSIEIYACGRSDIQHGLVDQPVLAMLAFLSASGLKPTVTALRCGNTLADTAFDKTGALSDNASGDGVDISAINGIPILGHQGPGSITDTTIRRLLAVQGASRPRRIVSLMSYRSSDTAISASDHADRIHLGFATLYDPHAKAGQPSYGALKPGQWRRLIARLRRIRNPVTAA